MVSQRTAGNEGNCRKTRAEGTATPFSSVTAMVGAGMDCAAAVQTRASVRKRARMPSEGYFTVGCQVTEVGLEVRVKAAGGQRGQGLFPGFYEDLGYLKIGRSGL